jgi:hypothetical protein
MIRNPRRLRPAAITTQRPRPRVGPAGRTLGWLSAGSLLGVAVVAGLTGTGASARAASAAPAHSSCVTHHTNVEGEDAGENSAFGNKGRVYINTKAVIDSLQSSIFRSFFVVGPPGWNVEDGWTANNGGQRAPQAYGDWEINGQTAAPTLSGQLLGEDSDHDFRIENASDAKIWRFYTGSESSPFAFSPTMNFNDGTPFTNSEHYQNCDSLDGGMSNLSFAFTIENWTSGYDNLKCAFDNSSTWFFHKDSNSALNVNQTSSSC